MRVLLLSFLLAVYLESGLSQSLNYQDIFGDDWKKAMSFEKENRIWIEPVLTENHISYPLAVSIIFPELVRYSALRDKMEITLLKTLYINLGEEYANFSIGVFQMKPSFAESIRDKVPFLPCRRSGIMFKPRSEFDDIKDFRKSIIADLEDPKIQLNYLIAFIEVCENNFKTRQKDEQSLIKFLATAYNFGIDKQAAEIDSMAEKKYFNTRLFKTENYSYAEVSLFWYRQFMSDK